VDEEVDDHELATALSFNHFLGRSFADFMSYTRSKGRPPRDSAACLLRIQRFWSRHE